MFVCTVSFLIFNSKYFKLKCYKSFNIIQSNRKSLKLWKIWSKPHKNQSRFDWEMNSVNWSEKSAFLLLPVPYRLQYKTGYMTDSCIRLKQQSPLLFFKKYSRGCPSRYSNQSGRSQIVVMEAKAVWSVVMAAKDEWSVENYFHYTHSGGRRLLAAWGLGHQIVKMLVIFAI